MAKPANDDVFERPDTSHHKKLEIEEGIISGQTFFLAMNEPVADGDDLEFVVPYQLYVNRVSVRARAVTNPGDGDVTVDVEDDGSSILASALSVAAADTTVEEDAIEHEVAAGSILRIVFALTGTGPALDGVTITIS